MCVKRTHTMYTIEQYTAITAAIAQGATTVKYGDKEVQYRSLTEMLQIQQIMATQLGINGTNPQNRGRRYAEFSKGIN